MNNKGISEGRHELMVIIISYTDAIEIQSQVFSIELDKVRWKWEVIKLKTETLMRKSWYLKTMKRKQNDQIAKNTS